MLLCWAVLTFFYLGRLVIHGAAPAPDRPFATPRTVDLNRAGIPELMTLPGLGRTRAAAVVLHRVRHGPFRTVDDLAQVDGLGPVTVERLRRHLRVHGK